MRTGQANLCGLLGAFLLAAGIAAPVTFGAEKAASNGESENIRINLPDGRVIVQRAAKSPSRMRTTPAATSSRRLADGSRVSVGSSSSGVSRHTSGARSATRGSSSSSSSRSIVATTRPVSSTQSNDHGTPQVEPTKTDSDSAESGLRVPSFGNAQHDGDGAVGGQKVSFKDVGIFGAVIGNTVYLVGVELVHADQSFDTIRGTRIGSESAIMIDTEFTSDDEQARFDRRTGLKLTFEPGSVVTLVMYSDSDGERDQRTWTVRID
jgi:hypothetical protein